MVLHNARALVLEKNTSKANLEGEKIPELHTYLSIQFRDTYMLLQRYYNIGKGVMQSYGNVRFTFSNNVIVSITSTSEASFQPPSKKEFIGLCVHTILHRIWFWTSIRKFYRL